jgi:hypothetical protein
MTRPFFVRERISEFDLFDRYTQKLLARVGEHVDRGAAMDLQDLFVRPAFDIRFGACLMRGIGSLNDGRGGRVFV